ncbi:MAG: antibiotic biosynthesis monooxygenase [Paludibacteraceae bacterium]|nr:antibiotic biosynthesis monooxygenase [Paludibacteraceae bacterium]
MIRLNCFFQANSPEGFANALAAAKTLTEKSQKHAGCKAYDVFTSATRSDVFMICETWENEDSLSKHSQTPEFAECVEIINQNGAMKIEKLNM